MKTLFIVLVIIFKRPISSTIHDDYYWRDYDGVIPKDAFVAGQDSNNNNIYIGQAFFIESKDNPVAALTVVEIHPGVRDVEVIWDTVHRRNTGVKILCTKVPYRFYWLKSTAASLDDDLIGKQAVPGGLELRKKAFPYFIGRVSDAGTTKIAKILPSAKGHKNLIYYADDNKEGKWASKYEVLLYNNNAHYDTTTTSAAPRTTPTPPPCPLTTTTTATAPTPYTTNTPNPPPCPCTTPTTTTITPPPSTTTTTTITPPPSTTTLTTTPPPPYTSTVWPPLH